MRLLFDEWTEDLQIVVDARDSIENHEEQTK